ncbi:Hypothetical predicted protein [Cloeon dipterum]|uniref:Uncharacterized protein n=1 Tax=Cloeon dipterum TaxID=197152 RepID=A0A8S1EEP7_9INSE|nr:Hypothetical predicted protein [Cloeon dipterum]
MDIKPVKYHPSDKDRVCVKFRVHDICRASRLFVSRFCCTSSATEKKPGANEIYLKSFPLKSYPGKRRN